MGCSGLGSCELYRTAHNISPGFDYCLQPITCQVQYLTSRLSYCCAVDCQQLAVPTLQSNMAWHGIANYEKKHNAPEHLLQGDQHKRNDEALGPVTATHIIKESRSYSPTIHEDWIRWRVGHSTTKFDVCKCMRSGPEY